MTTEYDKLWERVYSLQGIGPDDQSITSQVASLMHELEALDETSHGEWWLLRAYVAYHFSCQATSHINIEKELKEALRHDPGDVTARLYLGHYYYDTGKFADAKNELSQLDTSDYRRADQEWRALKIEEEIISASVWLGEKGTVMNDIDALLTNMQRCAPSDLAIPVELVQALSSNLNSFRANYGTECLHRIGNRLHDLVRSKFGATVLSAELTAITNA